MSEVMNPGGADATDSGYTFWMSSLGAIPDDVPFPEEARGGDTGDASVQRVLPDHVGRAIVELAAGDRLNAESIILAAVFIWAHRYTAEASRIMAVRSAETEGGLEAYTLVAFAFERGDTFRNCLRALRAAYIDALEHQHTGLAAAVSALGRANDRWALTVDFVTDHAGRFDVTTGTVCIDAHLDIAARRTSLALRFNSGQRSEAWMAGALSALVHIVERLITEPDIPLRQQRFLPEDEARLLTATFQGPLVEGRTSRTLLDLFAEQVRRTPDRIAVRSHQRSLTYAMFDRDINRLAWTLREAGVGPDVRVGVLAERSVERLVGIYAVLRAGGAYVPIDPDYPADRIRFVLQDAGAPVVLTQRHLAIEMAPSQRRIDLDDPASYAQSTESLPRLAGPTNLAYLIYTSGSTGRPKGVMIEHHSVVNRLEWMQSAYPLTDSDVILQKTPISFDVSVWELFWWALTGASVFLLDHGKEKDPDAIVRAVAEHGVTTMHFVPSMLDAFLGYVEADAVQLRRGRLRTVFASGEALRPSQVHQFQKHLGTEDAIRLVNLYGPTEATVDVTHFPVADISPNAPVPIGRPIDNTEIFVLGPDDRLTPIGVPGELVIAGSNLARGYHDRQELNEQKFVHVYVPELSASRRVYRTGDLARWLPDGTIEYLGRIDNQIKIRGYRIETGEIEEHLRRVPGVTDARVVGVFDADRDPFLCAYVIAPNGLHRERCVEALGAFLPDYMIPASFVPVERFPLMPNGKLDRKALPRPVLDAAAGDIVAPRTDTERLLLGIWKDVLKTDRIGIDTDFFSAGGDSIAAIVVLSRCKRAGIGLTFEQLFRSPTVRALAPLAVEFESPATPSADEPFSLLTPADRERLPSGLEDAYPLSALQVGLLFQGEVSKGASWYHDVLSYTFAGRFDAEAFSKAAAIVVRDNPIFRTSYHLHGYSELIQCVHADAAVPLTIEDWRAYSEAEQEQRYVAFVAAEQARAFDWGRTDLIRIFIQVLSDASYRYTLSFHDSTLDGWSINRVQVELFTKYFALKAGVVPPPTRKRNYFREYIRQERTLHEDPRARSYWTNLLTAPTFAEVPRLRPATSDVSEIQIRPIDIPHELSDAIKRLARVHAVPVKTVLLTAHVLVLSRLVGQADVITGYEHSGRPEEEDADSVMGLFLNTIPFRVDVDVPTWAALIRRVFDAEADLLPFRRYPLSSIKKDLRTTAPLFEVVFNFTHFHLLKTLQRFEGFDLLDVRVKSETEFVLRAEFSQHYYTDEVLLSLHYHANVFDEQHIARIGGYYRRALELMTADSASLHAHSLLSPEEIHRVSVLFNDSDTDQDFSRPAHAYVEEQARLAPARPAVHWRERSWSYGELNERANRVAQALATLQVPAEGRVAVYMDRTLEWVAAMLGVFKAGLVYVPVETGFPDERAAQYVEQSQCRVVVTEAAHEAALARILAVARVSCDVLIASDIQARVDIVANPPGGLDTARLAYVFFTSGSTGVPKGAMIEHRGMVNHLFAKIRDLRITDVDVVAQNSPLGFDISVWQLMAPLLVGASAHIYDQEQVLDVGDLVERLSADRVTIFETVPSYFAVMLNALERRPVNFTKLRYMVLNAEVLPPTDVRRWFTLYPEKHLVNAYGATECSDDVTHYHLTAPVAGRIPVGRPLQNMKIHVLDRHGHYVPPGTPGEIFCTGVGVGRGYLNRPEDDARAFLADQRGAVHGRMYRTGDFGCWTVDGDLHFLGRRDEQVKIRGFRIELDEIENVLLTIPGVRAAAVVPRDRADGQDLVAFVVSSGTKGEDLAAHLKARLPEYMAPSLYVEMDTLPLSVNGKVDRKRLKSRAALLNQAEGQAVDPVSTDEERYLRDLWAETLGLDPAHVGRTSDFFLLGGSSLTAMISALRSDGRYRVNDLFRHRTIRSLADMISAARGHTQPLHVLAPVSGSVEHTLVCFSYAGGDAFNFQPLADALRVLRPAYRVIGVEYERSADSSLADFADRLLSQLDVGAGELSVLGHCAGAAPALALAQAAESSGRVPAAVFLCGKLLREHGDIRAQIDEASGMTVDDILGWLRDKSGLTGLEKLTPAMAHTVAENFRWDTVEANRYLLSIAEHGVDKALAAPIVHVLSADDPTTRDDEHLTSRWSRLSREELRIVRLEGGGHYFAATRPHELARAIVAHIGNSGARQGELVAG